MKKVYITGHGLMAADGKKNSTLLKHSLYTYCGDGKMLEGGVGSTSIVDTGEYSPRDASSKRDAKAQVFESGTNVPTHYAYGGTSNLADYKDSVKMAAGKQRNGGLQGNKIQLDKNAGQLFRLGDDDYLYCTQAATLTSLDAIQDAIDIKLFQQEYEIHWVACRSYLEGGDADEMLKYVQENGADGDGVNKFVTGA